MLLLSSGREGGRWFRLLRLKQLKGMLLYTVLFVKSLRRILAKKLVKSMILATIPSRQASIYLVILKIMVYRLRKWWLLKELNERIETHSLELKLGDITGDKIVIGEPDEGFYDWVSRRSITRFWPVLPWRLARKTFYGHSILEPYPKKKLAEFAITNKLIIKRCIGKKEIEVHDGKNQNNIKRLIITPLGYEFMDDFWYKSIFENSIVKATIITALGLIVTTYVGYVLSNVLKPNEESQENKVYKIQIIP